MATRAKKKTKKVLSSRKVKKPVRKLVKKASHRKLVKASARVASRRPNPKTILWRRPEVVGLWGVGAALAVATVVYFVQRSSNTTQQTTARQETTHEVARTQTTKTETTAPAKSEGVLTSEFARASEMPMADRIAYWSQFVMNEQNGKGVMAKLVEGRTIEDSAPLMPGKFDCTTYVETIAALTRSKSSDDFYNRLIEIRYRKSHATFMDRNHFPEADWIPNNSRNGVLKDITTEIAKAAGVKVLAESKELNRVQWLAKQIESGKVQRNLASAAEKSWAKPVHVTVNYITLKDLTKASTKVTNGTIVNFVHGNHAKKDVLISHQGLLIRKGGTVYLRHASSSKSRVQEITIKDYLAKLSSTRDFKDWPIIGVNLNQINDR